MKHKESDMQIRIVRWFKVCYPSLILTCVPSYAKSIREGARNKRMGHCKGFPDLFIAYPHNGYNGMFLELKVKGGRLVKEQEALLDKLSDHGYKTVVAWSDKEAMEAIEKYLN